jgi:SCY1-like protein 1
MFQQIINTISTVSSSITNQGAPSTFKFQILEKQVEYQGLYELFDGRPKGTLNIPGLVLDDGTDVSVFVYRKSSGSDRQSLTLAQNGMRKLISVRHPSILRVLDSAENDSGIYIATEHVITLDQYRRGSKTLPTYGMFELMKGLEFLTTEAKLVHGNIDPGVSLFVTDNGSFRLGGLELARSKIDSSYHYDRQVMNCGLFKRYSCSDLNSVDYFGFVLLISYWVNGVGLPAGVRESSTLQELSGLVIRSFHGVDDVRSFVQDFVAVKSWDVNRYRIFQTEAVSIMSFLSNLHIHAEMESVMWLEALPQRLKSIDDKIFMKGVLFETVLSNVLSMPPLVAAAIPSVMFIASLMDLTDFKKRALPKIIQLLSIQDRTVRFRLLVGLPPLISLINDKKILESTVLLELLTGLTDSHPNIREQSMRTIVELAKHITPSEIEKKIIPNFSRLLKDPDASIRTNAIVSTGKAVGLVEPEEKQFALIGQCIIAGLKDPFPPAKATAIQLLAEFKIVSQSIAKEITTKYLPLVVMLLVDPDGDVARNAFGLMEKIVPQIRSIVPPPAKAEVQKQPPVSSVPLVRSTVSRGADIFQPVLSSSVPAMTPYSAPKPNIDNFDAFWDDIGTPSKPKQTSTWSADSNSLI